MTTTAKQLVNWGLHTALAGAALQAVLTLTRYRVFSQRTSKLMAFDLMRMQARRRTPSQPLRDASSTKLQFGCGGRPIDGWVNVDVNRGDLLIDLAGGSLPWKNDQFDVAFGEHVIEHLDLNSELIPFLGELNRTVKAGGHVWASCPDMEKACRAYLDDKAQSIVDDVTAICSGFDGMNGVPSQHFVNILFHQDGEHKNLFDFELLAWAFSKAGFQDCVKMQEADLLEAYPDIPRRGDDDHTLYVRATAS